MPPSGRVGTASSSTFAVASAAWISGSSWKRRALSREDQVGADAAAGEVPHAVGVLGAVRVGVEVAHAVVAGVLEQLHEVERVPDALGAEAEVLVVLARHAGALRSMWKSLPCHSVCATAWWNERPDIVSCANSGFSPTISG